MGVCPAPAAELEAVLRHYGAATRLLDLSRNIFVALWVRMPGQPERLRILMGVESNTAPRIDEKLLEARMPELLDALQPRKGQRFYVWEPRHLYERMRVQQAVFAFGPATRRPRGSVPFFLDDLVLIVIPPDLKTAVLSTATGGCSGTTVGPFSRTSRALAHSTAQRGFRGGILLRNVRSAPSCHSQELRSRSFRAGSPLLRHAEGEAGDRVAPV